MKVLFLLFASCVFCSPVDDLIIIQNFVSPETAQRIIRAYNAQKPEVNDHSDNGLDVASISDAAVRRQFYETVDRVIQLIQYKYGKRVELDHGALFARIPPNFASYHSDNIRFECPTHGTDQCQLRRVCDGKCPGARFVPNHTAWREFTALIYLNDNIEGGEILFEDGPCNKIYRKLIPIQACMLVLSPNGPDFYHEVLPMKKGKRQSMHLWFTTDSRHFHQRRY